MKNLKFKTIPKKLKLIAVGFLALAVVFSVYVYYGNTALQVTRYDIHSEKIPPGFDGFRIVQISDFHNSGNKRLVNSLVDQVESQKPDLILLTGDMIDYGYPDVNITVELIRKISHFAPVYFGNHEARTGEYYALSKAMRKIGVTELNNSYVIIRRNDDEIVIAGISDPMNVTDKTISDETIASERLAGMDYDEELFTVLLSHRPELISAYSANNIDLAFTGHAHGGLIRLPFIGGLYAPHQGLFPDYTAGLYQRGNTSMIVSRGVGNSGHTFRINDNPELVVTVLHAG